MKTVIGLEIHVSVNTKSKLFCGCANKESNEPNSLICPVCLGMPGSKPVLNEKALEYGLMLGKALNCKIAKQAIFSRKTYFYPDMAKNYQITQYEVPIGFKGKLNIGSKDINITRVHMEEDPAALIHQGNYVLVDYNRSGKPLLEIVTEPELNSPNEARLFLKRLITTLNYLGIYDEKTGSIKADANISIKGYERVEIKNITGFKEVERALNYEVERQKSEIENGNKIKRETRGWDAQKGITIFQRSKEEEADYGYIIDTDLVPVDLDFVEKIKIPELAPEKINKYVKQFKLKKDDAETIASEYILANLFEEISKKVNPQLAAKWLRRELMRVVHYNKIELNELKIDAVHLSELFKLIEKNKITETNAQKMLEELIEKPFSPKEYIKKKGLKVISGKEELEKICREIIKENPKPVEDYKNGNEKALHFISGQVMRKTKGQASPQEVADILKKLLK